MVAMVMVPYEVREPRDRLNDHGSRYVQHRRRLQPAACSINIWRTDADADGRVHSAVVSGINLEQRTVTVEWFERGETKGKEVVEIDAILALNRDLNQKMGPRTEICALPQVMNNRMHMLRPREQGTPPGPARRASIPVKAGSNT